MDLKQKVLMRMAEQMIAKKSKDALARGVSVAKGFVNLAKDGVKSSKDSAKNWFKKFTKTITVKEVEDNTNV